MDDGMCEGLAIPGLTPGLVFWLCLRVSLCESGLSGGGSASGKRIRSTCVVEQNRQRVPLSGGHCSGGDGTGEGLCRGLRLAASRQ